VSRAKNKERPETPTLDLAKLSKVCAMFQSNFPEERATAALLADNMVRSSGRTWENVLQLGKATGVQVSATSSSWKEPITTSEAVECCLDFAEYYTDWEQNFLISVSGRRWLSEKQMSVLDNLVDKARAVARTRRGKGK
jgi:hypothetical protein